MIIRMMEGRVGEGRVGGGFKLKIPVVNRSSENCGCGLHEFRNIGTTGGCAQTMLCDLSQRLVGTVAVYSTSSENVKDGKHEFRM